MSKQTVFLILSLFCIASAVPMLYVGLEMAVAVEFFPAFGLPSLLCMLLGAFCLNRAEKAGADELSNLVA